MIRQKSFENDEKTLFLVPTPIGNLSEMTPRAVEVLNSVDVIACEDTRTSGQLLKHFGISKRLIAYQNFNEESASRGILHLLEEGNNVALISDAGYPLISDPGQKVVTLVTEAGFNVVPLSGCSAVLNAVVASGLVVQPFLFIGFLPASNHDRETKLAEYRNYPYTMIFYEAPHRLEKMLDSCLKVLGDRKCCIAREMTKMHEEFIRGTLAEMPAIASSLKGEMVIVIEGAPKEQRAVDDDTLLVMVNQSMENGLSRSAAVKEVSAKTGLSKNRIYELVHTQEERN